MLLRGCVVTTTAADPQPFVILRQDFDRVIASVGVEVGRLVRKRILAAKLILNFDEGARHVGPPRCAFSSLSRHAKYKASYIAVPPPGLRARTPRESASVLSVKSCVTSGVTSKPTTNARSYLGRTVWFRNSMADSCSNLKRSRTELLASTRSPTCSGRSVSLWKLRISAAGLLSSTTLKSLFFKFFT